MPKSVQLSDEAYATLAALKLPRESFSDTVLRIAGERKDPTLLLRLGGMDPDFDYEKLHETSRQIDLRRLRARNQRK